MSITVGLDRTSPIPLESDPRKYEGLILRHGQWVRWSIAKKCTCVLANNRPDPRCTRCRGSGWRYSFQETEEDIKIQANAVDINLVEAPYDVNTSAITDVSDAAGRSYPIEGAYGRWVKVQGTPFQGRELVYLSVIKPRAKTLEGEIGTYLGHGIVQLDGNEYQNPWATVPYDIVSVGYVKDGAGQSYTVLDSAVNQIKIDDSIAEPVVGEKINSYVSYMPPARIAVINQNLSQWDRIQLQEIGGDAMAVFPFAYKVSEMDTITLWTGAQVRKKVLRKAIGDVDILPDLFVSRILSLEDADKTYTEGVDFIRWDRNTLRWIVDEVFRPAEGKNYSIEYMANVTYRVMQQMPNVRSSEDKRFPSRVALKMEAGTTGSDQV